MTRKKSITSPQLPRSKYYGKVALMESGPNQISAYARIMLFTSFQHFQYKLTANQWRTWRVADLRSSINVDTGERLNDCWHGRYVVHTAVVQSTVVCERKRTIRGCSYNISSKYICCKTRNLLTNLCSWNNILTTRSLGQQILSPKWIRALEAGSRWFPKFNGNFLVQRYARDTIFVKIR